jgi:predicted amidohydrolase
MEILIMRVSLIQMIIENSSNDNLNKVEEIVIKAAELFSQEFVCLPESFSNPRNFWGDSIEETFDKVYQPTISFLRELSRELRIYIVGGTVLEKDGNNFYNTSFLFESGKLTGKYRKTNVTDSEWWWSGGGLKRGKEYFVHNTEFGKIGILVCADILYPENTKTLSSMGADAIFLLISEPSERRPPDEGHTETISKSKDSSIFIFKTACIGRTPTGKRIGTKNAIVSPWGVVKETKNDAEDEIVSADLDLAKLRKHRNHSLLNWSC